MHKYTDKVLLLRFEERLTLREIGGKLGLSGERIRQILLKAGKKGTVSEKITYCCKGCSKVINKLKSAPRTTFCSQKCRKSFHNHICILCKLIIPGIDRSKNKISCTSCDTKRHAKWRRTDKGKKSIYKNAQAYEKRHPERRKAWKQVQHIPLAPCVKCGRTDTVRHHPNIKKPLEIVMLCHYCHILAHRTPSMV